MGRVRGMENESQAWQAQKRPAAFEACVNELLSLDEVRQLAAYNQHCNTSRLEHSIGVAYVSYAICKRLGLDFRAAARAGMLHDLFYYDWREMGHTASLHTYLHPKCALENAERLVADLTDIERNAIESHMWPLSERTPRYAESLAVSLADKICCVAEVAAAGARATKRGWKRIFA